MCPHSHLNSPYLDARRGLVQGPGDFGAELHHGDRYHRQGDLPALATPSLMAGSVIKSWDTANLLCHLLPCLLCRKPSCKPTLYRAAWGEGTPAPQYQLCGHPGEAANPSAWLAPQIMSPYQGPGWEGAGCHKCPSALPCLQAQGSAHPQHSSCSWMTLLHGGLFLPRSSRNWPCSRSSRNRPLSWHSLA